HRWLLTVLIVLVFTATLVFPQNPAPGATQKGTAAQHEKDTDEDDVPMTKPANANVPPGAPVITINGLCNTSKAGATPAKAECQTVITRSEFENLANTLQPSMNSQARRQLANAYPRLLVLEKEARRRGIDREPHYLETLKFVQMQLLNQELNRQ